MTTATELENQKELGDFCEIFVFDFFRLLGYNVNFSENEFDQIKDLTINGHEVEVKGQVPYYARNAFTVETSQVAKCSEVPFLFFVEIPQYDDKLIRIWNCENRSNVSERVNGKIMHLYDVKKMTPIFETRYYQRIEEVRNLSNCGLSKEKYEKLRQDSVFGRKVLRPSCITVPD